MGCASRYPYHDCNWNNCHIIAPGASLPENPKMLQLWYHVFPRVKRGDRPSSRFGTIENGKNIFLFPSWPVVPVPVPSRCQTPKHFIPVALKSCDLTQCSIISAPGAVSRFLPGRSVRLHFSQVSWPTLATALPQAHRFTKLKVNVTVAKNDHLGYAARWKSETHTLPF